MKNICDAGLSSTVESRVGTINMNFRACTYCKNAIVSDDVVPHCKFDTTDVDDLFAVSHLGGFFPATIICKKYVHDRRKKNHV